MHLPPGARTDGAKKFCIMQTFFANSASNPRCRICSPKAEKVGHLARLFRLYLLNTLLRRTFSSHLRHACFHAHLRVTHRPMHCKDRRPFLVPDRTIIHIARLGLAPRGLLCAARADPPGLPRSAYSSAPLSFQSLECCLLFGFSFLQDLLVLLFCQLCHRNACVTVNDRYDRIQPVQDRIRQIAGIHA